MPFSKVDFGVFIDAKYTGADRARATKNLHFGHSTVSVEFMTVEAPFSPPIYPIEKVRHNTAASLDFLLFAAIGWSGAKRGQLVFGASNMPIKSRPPMERYVFIPTLLENNSTTGILVRQPAQVSAEDISLLESALRPLKLAVALTPMTDQDVISLPNVSVDMHYTVEGERLEFTVTSGQLALASLRALAAPSIIHYQAGLN